MDSGMARILVADDDPMIIRLLDLKLAQAGFEVMLAEDGITALETALRELPDLVILDGMMPGMDGIEVLERLQAEDSTKGIPVIMLTARGNPDEVDGGLARGAADYLAKPVKPNEVVESVTRILGLGE